MSAGVADAPEKCLRIECDRGKSWIEIVARRDSRDAAYEIGCGIDLGHGNFFARNSDLHFLNMPAFVGELDRFMSDRSLTPQLSGTFGSFLILWQPGTRDQVMLSFAIGDAYGGGPVNTEFSLTGSFLLPEAGLATILSGFHGMLNSAPEVIAISSPTSPSPMP